MQVGTFYYKADNEQDNKIKEKVNFVKKNEKTNSSYERGGDGWTGWDTGLNVHKFVPAQCSVKRGDSTVETGV